ncbi:MAG: hypothetical protein J7576_19260 [Siphonobacter aquaeclarae]|nr:hypothetical protein [Siphonobacter aquaeclarae]
MKTLLIWGISLLTIASCQRQTYAHFETDLTAPNGEVLATSQKELNEHISDFHERRTHEALPCRVKKIDYQPVRSGYVAVITYLTSVNTTGQLVMGTAPTGLSADMVATPNGITAHHPWKIGGESVRFDAKANQVIARGNSLAEW